MNTMEDVPLDVFLLMIITKLLNFYGNEFVPNEGACLLLKCLVIAHHYFFK